MQDLAAFSSMPAVRSSCKPYEEARGIYAVFTGKLVEQFAISLNVRPEGGSIGRVLSFVNNCRSRRYFCRIVARILPGILFASPLQRPLRCL